jgi:putative transcriptional regulator
MINHHPKIELLIQHVNGELPASISAGIKIHADLCTKCNNQIIELTKHAAKTCLGSQELDSKEFGAESFAAQDHDEEYNFDAQSMINNITDMPAETELNIDETPLSVTFRGVEYDLPNVMKHMSLGKSAQIGKLSRSRILLDEGHIHSSLLRIEAGGSIPEHTHKGYEITLLLEGSFKDDMGEYVAGDFIVLDGKHQHQPMSELGCLCYTVVSDSLHFTQGINKLLNPIGSFIY